MWRKKYCLEHKKAEIKVKKLINGGKIMIKEALGIETRGLTALVEAVDAMVKQQM